MQKDNVSANNMLKPGDKHLLTVTEAASYFNMCDRKIRKIIKIYPRLNLVLMNGNNMLIKRKKFEEFLDELSEI